MLDPWNIDRFPKDFMFELTKSEFGDLRSQIGASSRGGTRCAPMVFTENGVAILSSVLKSEVTPLVDVCLRSKIKNEDVRRLAVPRLKIIGQASIRY